MAQKSKRGGRREGAGRPPKADGEAFTARIPAFFTPDDASWLSAEAEAGGVTEAAVLRELVRRARKRTRRSEGR